MKFLKNTTESDIVLEGYTLTSGQYQLIDPNDYARIGESEILYSTYLPLGQIIASSDDTGYTDITDVNLAINFLKNLIPQRVSVDYIRWYSNSEGFRANWKGYKFTCTAGQVTDLYIPINEMSRLVGMQVILDSQAIGDKATLSIVDKDGVYYDPDTVLDVFVSDWYFSPNACQGDIKADIPAEIYPGLYIKISYTSVGSTDVTAIFNTYKYYI